jgi:hypothetical protein
VAEKKKYDNNSDSSDQNRSNETRSFETKLDILKHVDNAEGHGGRVRSLGLSRSTMSITGKNVVKIMEHVKSAGSL